MPLAWRMTPLDAFLCLSKATHRLAPCLGNILEEFPFSVFALALGQNRSPAAFLPLPRLPVLRAGGKEIERANSWFCADRQAPDRSRLPG